MYHGGEHWVQGEFIGHDRRGTMPAGAMPYHSGAGVSGPGYYYMPYSGPVEKHEPYPAIGCSAPMGIYDGGAPKPIVPPMLPALHPCTSAMSAIGNMGSVASPVLSVCSGRSDCSQVPNKPVGHAGSVNPGLSLLCRAVEEAHAVAKPKPAGAGAVPAKGSEIAQVKGPWSAEEDRLLRELVGKFGPKRWTAIASFIAGRTGKQSRERWLNHLNPDLSKRPWTEDEDRIIMEAHHELGNKWSEIAKRLRGRTDNSVKNRFNTTIRRQISEYSHLVRSQGGGTNSGTKRKAGGADDARPPADLFQKKVARQVDGVSS